MELIEKYIAVADNVKTPDLTKTVLSNDAYAIVEFLDKLIKATEVLAIK